MHAPSILIADEPTSQVDEDTAALIMAGFKTLSQRGIAVVIASHASE
ncbi:MAG: hypothetical protein U1E76_16430 [Planctomycetota bacterium]